MDRALADGDIARAARDGRGKPATLGDLVDGYLATQSDVIACNDIGLRTSQASEAAAGRALVHKTRIAVRRLRSVLRLFSDLFEAEQRADFDAELVWYADLLGRVRDCDVLAERLPDRVRRLPVEHVLGPVQADLDKTLTAQRREAWDNLRTELDSARYANLLGLVRDWRATPPLTPAATAKVKHVGRYVDKAERKAAKRLRQADGDPQALHRARKAAKRLRYVAQLAATTDPRFASVAKEAKARQTKLGEHQDAVVAAQFLRRLGAAEGSTPGHNGFTYGLLMANELAEAAAIRAKTAISG